MKRLLLLLPAAFGMLALASCGGTKAGENENNNADKYFDSIRLADSLAKWGPPTALDWKQLADKANDKKRVTVEGYVALPGTSYSSSGSAQIDMFERKNQYNDSRNFIVSINTGKGNNTMRPLKDGYLAPDLQITGDKGEAIVFNDRVRLTGILSVQDSYSSIDVQLIEKLDAVTLDYSTLGATELTAANHEDPALEGQLVVAEGMLEVPMFLMLGGEDIFMNLQVKGIEKSVYTDIAYGSTPGRIEDIPKDYKDSDFKVHADDGSIISLKKKVRVYGVLVRGRIKLESIQNI